MHDVSVVLMCLFHVSNHLHTSQAIVPMFLYVICINRAYPKVHLTKYPCTDLSGQHHVTITHTTTPVHPLTSVIGRPLSVKLIQSPRLHQHFSSA